MHLDFHFCCVFAHQGSHRLVLYTVWPLATAVTFLVTCRAKARSRDYAVYISARTVAAIETDVWAIVCGVLIYQLWIHLMNIRCVTLHTCWYLSYCLVHNGKNYLWHLLITQWSIICTYRASQIRRFMLYSTWTICQSRRAAANHISSLSHRTIWLIWTRIMI
jgi:hypothetical protein